MSHPILITGAAGGRQGSTGRVIAKILLEQGLPVRAFVHKLDARSDELRQKGAEIVEGDLLDPASVHAAMKDVKRAYFTYPVIDGLLEAATIFAATARDASLELVVNNSQLQGTPGDPAFRDLQAAPSFRNFQHRPRFAIFKPLPHSAISSIGSSIASSTGRRLGPFIFRRRPIMKTSALLSAVPWPRKTPLSFRGAMATPAFPWPAPKMWPAWPQLFWPVPACRPKTYTRW
ncbi:hypothetical protein SBA5_690015 [Candidatus Sulfotelmatomonas gaucii]|uniref:NAD(P)-binding domain-containing protein n=1 Tax=Candidatus Sulfuritelmatomonas gaucii TaxID=2043161 RepID=A0A2N9LZZ3_9BACT|nr:hypothetical protein SBA5_690015 [Candidatus Sulfotelmatomonas gaucii]